MALISALPRDCATARAINGDAAEWTLTDHLLAGVFDTLRMISWQLGGDKHATRPRPTPRPGVQGPTRYGRTKRDPDEVIAYLRRFAPRGGDAHVA